VTTSAVPSPAGPGEIAKRATVPVLTWHQLRDYKSSDSASARAYIMPPAKFRAQLDALVEAGYHAISPDQYVALLKYGAKLPSRPVLLTFDDGVDDHLEVALPELRKHGFTATFFIMTVVLGKKDYLSKADVRALEAAGMTIGSHTWDHHRVDRYHGSDWKTQITEPAQDLAEIIGHPVKYFAYPFGVWDRSGFSHLEKAGFVAAFQLSSDPMDKKYPLLTLRRMIANPSWSRSALLRALD
jgi:peptidoglycan/xylan/chitin deacetylase (PgdA/CDA1 family)